MPRLFIVTPTAVTAGGVERILESLANGLPRRGFDVVFGLARGARFNDPRRFREALPAIDGIELDARSGTSYARRRALVRAIRKVDPDVVLSARIFDVYPAAAELKLAGHRLRLTTTVQAYESEYFADVARFGPFLDYIVTSGNLVANALAELVRFPAERIRSIPGGVAAPRRLVAHRAAPLRIGYVGRLEQVQKRVLDFCAFAEALERRGVACELVVAGSGSAEPELRRCLPRASFLGWLSTDALYDRVYPELDVFVHFAEWEGITIAPREAMAHGVVPVVSRFVGLEAEGQFVDGENALTFPVGDVDAAAEAIVRLDRDRALLARLSENARASQGGIRSEEGALDAWAESFRAALELPQRRGEAVPEYRGDEGFLARRGIPPPLAELIRRMRGRRAADAGAEWPHWSGLGDEELARRLAEFAR